MVSNPKEYAQHLADADALVVRSAVQVTPRAREGAEAARDRPRRAWASTNVDLDAATAAGVLVMNTPGGNAVSVAEHTLALMLAMARHIPQAIAFHRRGKWEKKKFLGNELRGKTLGMVGLGSIGREVVSARARLKCASSPTIPTSLRNIATDLGVELVDLRRAVSRRAITSRCTSR